MNKTTKDILEPTQQQVTHIREYIRIEDPKISGNKTLMFQLTCSKKVQKFFSSNMLVFEYDQDISGVDPSILSIPAVASIIGAAWAIGADVHVESLDDKYVEALNRIKLVIKEWYPKLPFSTELVTEPGSNSCPADKFGLLFTGGLDAVTSYIKHREKDLTLITVSGKGGHISSYKQNNNELNGFLTKKSPHNMIKTNIEQVLDVLFFNKKFSLDWWMNIAHGTVLTSLCAPLTCVEKIGTLFISSSFTYASNFAWGSHPLIDNKLRWANTKVVHDNFEANRQEKIRVFLKDYITETGKFPTLKVCSYYADLGANCQRCEKCSRTIVGLLVEGIDPNKCGFIINANTLNRIKESLRDGQFFRRRKLAEKGLTKFNRTASIDEWEEIREVVPEKIEKDDYGAKQFFEWLRDFDITRNVNEVKLSQVPRLFTRSFFEFLDPLFQLFPSRLQRLVKQIETRFLKVES